MRTRSISERKKGCKFKDLGSGSFDLLVEKENPGSIDLRRRREESVRSMDLSANERTKEESMDQLRRNDERANGSIDLRIKNMETEEGSMEMMRMEGTGKRYVKLFNWKMVPIKLLVFFLCCLAHGVAGLDEMDVSLFIVDEGLNCPADNADPLCKTLSKDCLEAVVTRAFAINLNGFVPVLAIVVGRIIVAILSSLENVTIADLLGIMRVACFATGAIVADFSTFAMRTPDVSVASIRWWGLVTHYFNVTGMLCTVLEAVLQHCVISGRSLNRWDAPGMWKLNRIIATPFILAAVITLPLWAVEKSPYVSWLGSFASFGLGAWFTIVYMVLACLAAGISLYSACAYNKDPKKKELFVAKFKADKQSKLDLAFVLRGRHLAPVTAVFQAVSLIAVIYSVAEPGVWSARFALLTAGISAVANIAQALYSGEIVPKILPRARRVFPSLTDKREFEGLQYDQELNNM